MSRVELSRLLDTLVSQSSITSAQRDEVLALYDAGELTADQLPLPLSEAEQEPDNMLGSALLAVALLLGGVYGVRVQSGQAGIPLARRERVRDTLRTAFERRMRNVAPIAATGNVRSWHSSMVNSVRNHILEQTILGVAAPLAGELLAETRDAIREQMGFLQRFAGRVAVAAATGAALTTAYIAARAILYAGAGWAGFFRGNESGIDGERGMVAFYRAKDDGSTCTPCIAAALGSPYLPSEGPYPGDVCLGRGLCRCTRELVYDLAAWQRLTGIRAAA